MVPLQRAPTAAEHDVEAWSNAIICALQSGQAEVAVALLHVSIGQAGLDAYDALRANLVAQGAHSSLLAELDKLAIEADERQCSTELDPVTLRIVDGDNAIVIGGSGD